MTDQAPVVDTQDEPPPLATASALPPDDEAVTPTRLPPVPPGADLARSTLPARGIMGIFAVTFLVYLAFVPHFLQYSSPPTGDQPFYLMDTISLAQDGDLELSNNYANHDEDKFYRL